jgi:hypothetical protein
MHTSLLATPLAYLEIPLLLTWKSLLCDVAQIPVHSCPRLAVNWIPLTLPIPPFPPPTVPLTQMHALSRWHYDRGFTQSDTTLFILMTTHLKEVMKIEDDKIYTQYVLHQWIIFIWFDDFYKFWENLYLKNRQSPWRIATESVVLQFCLFSGLAVLREMLQRLSILLGEFSNLREKLWHKILQFYENVLQQYNQVFKMLSTQSKFIWEPQIQL